MSLYIHHVPGRLRVRTQSFRCQPSRVAATARRLSDLGGVGEVTISAQAGSITVQYDPAQRTQLGLLGLIEALGCIGAGRTTTPQGGQVTNLFGKALLGALAQTVAQRSVQTLVGVLL